MKINYLGHSTILLDFYGMRVITDPVFRSRIFHLVRTTPIPDPEGYQRIDLALISHLHYDHLDLHSLRLLNRETLVCAPKGVGSFLAKNGINNILEMAVGEEVKVGKITIRSTYAEHTNRRHPLGFQAQCMGFIIEDDISVYFPGDTILFPEMSVLSDHLDVALMPVWGWGPHLGRKHMSPKEAANALTLLEPRYAIPIHWGTYLPNGLAWLRPKFHFVPPLIFAEAANEITPQVEIIILKPGEATEILAK